MLAKVLVLAAIAGITGAAATVAVILASQVILSPERYAPLLSEPGAWRAATAFTLLVPLGAVTGREIGTLLRRPVTAVVTVVAVLTLLPGLARSTQDPESSRRHGPGVPQPRPAVARGEADHRGADAPVNSSLARDTLCHHRPEPALLARFPWPAHAGDRARARQVESSNPSTNATWPSSSLTACSYQALTIRHR
jgi:hypothetical protein